MTPSAYTRRFRGMARNLGRGLVAVVFVALSMGACGGSDAGTRIVQIDYKHDDFAAAFNAYFPKKLSVHPGDTVRFENTWSGEPHSVTLGRVVDDIFEYTPIFDQYESEEAALAGGITQQKIDEINATFNRIPGMTTNGYEVYQPGAKPCYINKIADVPSYGSDGDEAVQGQSTVCPKASRTKPAFTGRQALFNSGLIPFNGDDANTFELTIADDATPGTYNYFCTYHWLGMSGELTIAESDKDVPSSAAVIKQARKEINAMEKPLARQVAKVAEGDFGDLGKPVAGLPVPGDDYAWVNEFYPRTTKVKVGEPLTWSVHGATHNISFNVPDYFPVFRVDSKGDVVNDKRVDKPVGWTVEPPQEVEDGESQVKRKIDVGEWNGAKQFRSSGLLFDGETFTMTFTKPGTYPYACLLHPPMIGTVEVSA